ncbi:neuropeptide S receptor-like [Saccostrea echinata]|uniref:neuropeptide S receptor-like n=1 Tax=Saccostrea echinata TaxID=191078 RepID=UPI002A7FAB04|nr:neuropeptide S receptor-like [Saccostrea echinata]
MNYTAEDLNDEVTQYLYFNTALLSLYLVVGLSGNSSVLYIYTRKMRKTEERYFIPLLAVSDIFACLAGIILGIVSNFYRANYVLDTFCKVGYFFTWTTTSISGFLILLIALSRHLRICRPTGLQLNTVRKRRAMVIMSSISFVTSLPMLYFLGSRDFPFVYKGQLINTTICTLRFSDSAMKQLQNAYFAFEIFLASLNMIVTCGLYIPVGVTIYRRFKVIQQNMNASTNVSSISEGVPVSIAKRRICISTPEHELSVISNTSEVMSQNEMCSKCTTSTNPSGIDYKQKVSSLKRRKNSRRRQVRHNFTLMFATIILIYVLAYLPTLVLFMLPGEDPPTFWFTRGAVELNVLVFLQRAFLLNNILNPFIYTYFDLSFRHELNNILCFCRKKH